MSDMGHAASLAVNLGLDNLLSAFRDRFGSYTLIDHWQQGEFHHDVVIAPAEPADVGIFVVATNCNGGVKEIWQFASIPEGSALWHHRCPDSPEFSGTLPALRDYARTLHWFDSCALIVDDARSEIRAEHRERQPGGGWRIKRPASRKP